jgi:hypothetical protein
MKRLALLALIIASTTLLSTAQRSGGGFAHFSHASAPPGARMNSVFGSRQNLEAYRRLYRNVPYGDFLTSLGALSDFTGDPSTYGASSAPPNFFLMPPPSANGMIDDQPHTGAQPLMIELRGDHYVRITSGHETSENDSSAANYQQPPIAGSARAHSAPAQPAGAPIEISGSSSQPARTAEDLQPAVLIYRDGHTESVRDYAITAGKLYARGNYYSDGYWTKTIDLAALNIPATISSNAGHGIDFILPAAPNEVVTRP